MGLAAVVATQLTTPEARTLSVFVGARDVTHAVDPDGTMIEDGGGSARSVSNLRLWGGLADLPEVADQARVRMVDHSDESEAFTGYVRSRHPITGVEPMVGLVADDIGGILDDTFVPSEARPSEGDAARIGFLWGKYAGSHLSGDLSLVQSINPSLPAANYVAMTLRQALEHVAAQASETAQIAVDMAGRPHYFEAEAVAAPASVVVGTPGAGEIAPEDLDIDYDSGVFFNAVYVQGKTAAGSGWFYDHASIAAHNGLVRSTPLSAPDCDTAIMATALAQMYLGRVAVSQARGRFSTDDFAGSGGWHSGQNVQVTDPDHGLDVEEFRLARVVTAFVKVDGQLRRRYAIDFGGSRRGQSPAGSITGGGPMVGQGVVGLIGEGSEHDVGLGNTNTLVSSTGVTVTDGA